MAYPRCTGRASHTETWVDPHATTRGSRQAQAPTQNTDVNRVHKQRSGIRIAATGWVGNKTFHQSSLPEPYAPLDHPEWPKHTQPPHTVANKDQQNHTPKQTVIYIYLRGARRHTPGSMIGPEHPKHVSCITFPPITSVMSDHQMTPPAVKGAGETDQGRRTDLPARSTTATGGGCVWEIIRAYLGGFSRGFFVAGDLCD